MAKPIEPLTPLVAAGATTKLIEPATALVAARATHDAIALVAAGATHDATALVAAGASHDAHPVRPEPTETMRPWPAVHPLRRTGAATSPVFGPDFAPGERAGGLNRFAQPVEAAGNRVREHHQATAGALAPAPSARGLRVGLRREATAPLPPPVAVGRELF